MVGPGEFVGIMEETGLIEPIGRWVLETACDRGPKRWSDEVGDRRRQFRSA